MLKETTVSTGSLYIGRNAGSSIFRSIEGAKRSIRILSPYLSLEFVDKLKERAATGIDVALIVSSDFATGDGARNEVFRSLFRQIQHTDAKKKRRRTLGMRLLLASLLVAMLVVVGAFVSKAYHIALYALAALPVIALAQKYIVRMRIFTYSYEKLLNFTVTMSPYSDGFNRDYYLTHAKMFLVDDVAYVGSVNFTRAAFEYNYESRITIRDSAVVQKMEEEFEYMFSNNNTYYMDVDSFVPQLFHQPAN